MDLIRNVLLKLL